MNPSIAVATAARVLTQLRRDRRTLGLLIVVPCVLLTLIKYVYDGDQSVFQRIGLPMVGIFPLVSMFLVTSIAMLRERRSGTLERLMSMPLAKLDLLAGYGLAFALVGVVQALAASFVAIELLGLRLTGPTPMVVVIAVANAILGMALGLFLSAFASTEFQAVQFLPAFLLPQFFLCGLVAPRGKMAKALQWLADLLPLTYAYDALHRLSIHPNVGATVWFDILITLGVALGCLCLAAITLRRRTA